MSSSALMSPIPGARVLVVDDDELVRSALARSLTLLGYCTDEADSGARALAMLEGAPYDVMVLDIRMPGLDGVEVLQWVHRLCPDLIVIVLTGHASLESAVAAVRYDAIDYLKKPITVPQLAAAISDALEKHSGDLSKLQLQSNVATERVSTYASGGVLRVGPVALDCECRHVVVDGSLVRTAELTAKEAAILACLMKRPRRVFSCRQLVRVALGYNLCRDEAQSIVRPHIYRLRRKLETNPGDPRLIQTVRGRGYLFTF